MLIGKETIVLAGKYAAASKFCMREFASGWTKMVRWQIRLI